MPKLEDLTKKEWSRIKKNAGIEKNKKLGKSDASVSKYVEALVKARTKFNTEQTSKNIASYFKALTKMDEALDDFVDAKDLDTAAAKSLKKDIGEWRKEIADKRRTLAALVTHFDKLVAKEDLGALNKKLAETGLGAVRK